MDQETAFIQALEGAALIEPRATTVNLTNLQGSLKVALIRPAAEAEAAPSASPGASAPPAATPSPAPTPSPTPAPTPTPLVTPAPTPTPASAPPATASPSAPAPSAPPTAAFCNLNTAAGATVAQIAYPGSWFTVTTPANLACQYFDPAPITVPADPATLTTAIQASVTDTIYADAVTAATDTTAWTVQQQTQLTLDNLPATMVAATATSDAAGIPAGVSRVAYLVNVGSAGTVTLWTAGAATDESFADYAAILSLMTEFSEFTAPS